MMMISYGHPAFHLPEPVTEPECTESDATKKIGDIWTKEL